ncbi:conserved hypothetical protein [Gluconacetobacter diazotrophicus PA1 5]|nr:hypothetical protein [Gluconacetobacter diazotrophicus]ACI51047.1 conserved hypothetical protein [Gluconacetobacter diazotrophicus PA1 5]TWB00972.1 hypothetical protein FBZ86_13225 [Gluconacetobacter diazotrophicus]
MVVRIEAPRPRHLALPVLLAAGLALMGAGPAQARHHGHQEHTIYGSVSGYQAVIDRDSPEYKSADSYCQTQASVDASINGSTMQSSGTGGGGGNQFQRLKYTYAACMASRGAWDRINNTKIGDQPSSE